MEIKELIHRLINRKSRKDRRQEGVVKEKIVTQGNAMKRLEDNPDFKMYIELLKEGEAPLMDNVLSGEHRETRDLLIARINQIEDCIKLPTQVIWRMENLPEYIEARRAKK